VLVLVIFSILLLHFLLGAFLAVQQPLWPEQAEEGQAQHWQQGMLHMQQQQQGFHEQQQLQKTHMARQQVVQGMDQDVPGEEDAQWQDEGVIMDIQAAALRQQLSRPGVFAAVVLELDDLKGLLKKLGLVSIIQDLEERRRPKNSWYLSYLVLSNLDPNLIPAKYDDMPLTAKRKLCRDLHKRFQQKDKQEIEVCVGDGFEQWLCNEQQEQQQGQPEQVQQLEGRQHPEANALETAAAKTWLPSAIRNTVGLGPHMIQVSCRREGSNKDLWPAMESRVQVAAVVVALCSQWQIVDKQRLHDSGLEQSRLVEVILTAPPTPAASGATWQAGEMRLGEPSLR
jgi:hypothetical protein